MTVLKWKWPAAGLIFLVACLVCLFVLQSEELSVIPFCVEINASEGTEQIVPWENEDGAVYVFLPAYADMSKALFRIGTTDEAHIQNTRLVDQMSCEAFQLDVSYELTFSSWGKIHHRQMMFVQSADVPTMYIDTESGSMAYIHAKKGNEEAGEMRLYLADGSLSYAGEINDINGRGNNTWTAYEKKPYSVKLVEEADLLGMGAAQRWILLANADDPSHMRNKIVFDFADEIGLAYSPDADWVDLYLNGEYAGLYLLSERNEVQEDRVELFDEKSFLVSLELVSRLSSQGYSYIITDNNQALRIHYPEEIDKSDKEKLLEIWQSIENGILDERNIDPRTGKELTELIDMESWVNKYLIDEMFANGDGGAMSQFFYYAGGIVYAGPVWDYDHSMGLGGTWQIGLPTTFYSNCKERWANIETPWFHCLYKDKTFFEMMVNVYQEKYLGKLSSLLNEKIYKYLGKIKDASYTNQIRWGIATDSIEAVESICSYLTERNVFLHKAWVQGVSYKQVKTNDGLGGFLGCFTVEVGNSLSSLPTLPNNAYQTFLGWYYEDTDEPFDPTRPIYEDTAVYAKWKDTPYKRISQIKKLLPAGVIAIMFLAILAADVRRMRKGG